MNINKELLLIRNLILDEIHNYRPADSSSTEIEKHISYLTSLLRKTSSHYQKKINHNERLDLVSMINNRINYLHEELVDLEEISDLNPNEIYTLEILLNDYQHLLKKFVS